MNITTKFSVGQMVFAIMEQKIAWGTVEGVEVKAIPEATTTLYKVKFVYNGNEFTHAAYEENLFETVGDLMTFLKEQVDKDIALYQDKQRATASKKPVPPKSDWANVKSWIP